MLNQARRISPSSLPPPSSPPSVSLHDGGANSPSEARGVPSLAQTLWTTPSPTQTLGHSSPELPPLATLSSLRALNSSPNTGRRSEGVDSGTFFTASWGSPYRHPPPSFNRDHNSSAHLGSDDIEEDSSGLHFSLEHLLPRPLEEDDSPGRFNLEHLLPLRLEQDQSPNQFNLEHLIPSRLPNNLETPTKVSSISEATPRPTTFNVSNPSEDWVRQFLDGRWNRAENSWLSDGSAESELGNRAERHQKSSGDKSKSHRAHRSNKTLNQQDFWSHFSEGQKEQLGKMMASRYADPDAHSRQGSGSSLRSALSRSIYAEKPPASPKEDAAPESPKPQGETPRKPQEQTPLEPVYTPRPRKKLYVMGKNCFISIPRDIPRGTPGYPPKPMSPAAIESKMQQFERAGLDTRGFGNWGGVNSGNSTPLPQNRGIWPDEDEVRADFARGHRVRVPNKADWDAYVKHLTEAKLASLGVSVGGEEEETPMSRQASSQHPGLPFSPPLPTSSAGSHRIRQGSVVSGSFPLGPSPGHASRQSIASPISAFGNSRASMHMHRHSTFASPASLVQHTASPSGAWSPGNYLGQQGARGGSPALPLSRPDLADIVSPGSPFGIRPGPQFPLTPTQKDDRLVQMQQQQQQLLGLRPSSTLAEVPEDEAEEEEAPVMKNVAQPTTEIAVPTPRGHRHNISANLEREARDAEYHLEQAIDKQFDEGGDFSTEPEITPEELKPSNPVTDSTWEGSRPILHQPQPHSRAHSLAKPQHPISFSFGAHQPENPRGESDGARTNVSDATNPSLEDDIGETATSSAQHSKAASQVSNSWKDSKFAFGKPGSAMHSKHTSRSSMSKLNVDAKEFKLNPSASFSPGSGSFSSSLSFSPAFKNNGFDAPPRSAQPSIDGLSSLNVSAASFKPDAPVFKPDAPSFKPTAPAFKPAIEAPVFKPAVMNGSSLPTSGFNFLSNGPSFKPNAPVFNPGSAEFKPKEAPPVDTNFSSKIFGNVNISGNDIKKPAKRSKAIPIVRPDATRQKTPEQEEHKEDEGRRIEQADGREKRARRGRADDDDIPKFALQPILPSQPSAESRQLQAAKQDAPIERDAAPEDKENLSPNTERAPSKSKSPEPLSLRREIPAAEPDVPTPKTDKSTDAGTSIDDRTPHESEAPTPTVEDAPSFAKKHGHKSSLSATAKPFEFRPQFATSGYDFGLHVTKPSVPQNEDLDNSHITSSRYASRSPATTFRPSDDGSYKTALSSRRHVPYPESESVDFDHLGQASFNDIDAIMKHMNEEGSDFGVERDEPSWEQSSPRISSHDFERSDLLPNSKLRSDAPSPSPRRLYVPRNMHASSTSITQDPFDDERAGLAYESPVHRLNNADEVPMSDWDEGLLSEGEDKIQTRSRFFDSHVDDIIGRLLQSRLDPLERNLQGIQDSIALMSQRRGRGRRSMSTEGRFDSDADDEDDEIGTDSLYRNRSPRKDRKMEKIRLIIKEALEAHQEAHQPPITSLPMPVSSPVLPKKIHDMVMDSLATQRPQSAHGEQAEPVQPQNTVQPQDAMQPENVRDVIMEALSHHQPQWTPPKFEPVPAEEIRAIVEDAIVAHQPPPAPVPESVKPDEIRAIVENAIVAHQPPPAPIPEPVKPDEIRAIVETAIVAHQLPPAPIVEPVKSDEIRSILADVLKSHAPEPVAPAVEPIKTDDIRSIVMEAISTHVPQSTPAPVPEQIWPDDIKSIITEALASQPPAAEPIQPDAIRSIVAEALSSHQQQALPESAPEIVQPDMIRSIVEEALTSHKPTPTLEAPVDIPQPQIDLSEIYQVIGSLKASIAQTTSNHLQAEDVRELLEDAFKKQNSEIAKREETQAIEERDIRIADLESMLKEATLRLDTEVESREALEAREADSTRLLRVTEEELHLLKTAANDDEAKIRALEDECADTRRSLDASRTDDGELRNKFIALQEENEKLSLKAIAFESSEEDIKKKLDAVTAENEALTFTLEEHRLSSNRWRNDIQQAHEETERMRKAIDHSRLQAEEASRVREAMRAKFEKLQQDMVVASGQAAAERAQWQKSDEAHLKKYEILSARIEAEGRTRERLERELERLESQEREGMKLRVTLEQTLKHNDRLEETIEQLKQETTEHQRTAERYEREFREAREAGHIEIRRTRVLMEADIEAANNQVNIVRADLEAEVARVRGELDNARMDIDTTKAKHELDLEAASDAKKQAVEEALKSKKISLQEQQQSFERRTEQLTKEHVRALDIAREDKERAEAYYNDRLSLADSKMEHLENKVALLEEKLSVAKEAASAAAAAAKSIKSPPPTGPRSSYASGVSDKISPQALRESIAVLQEQLQERESRIEKLEHNLAEVDTDAPAKLKERDTEISWLRELLGVRIDDLNDLINSLAQPAFDRETVRDAAIRIRTNLQMEQQEKERLMTGGQSFPTLATLSNFASPKAVQLAAAIGNWRKGRDNGSSAPSGSSSNSRNQTPSRIAPASSQSFLSGLMTPPTSNLRRTPDLPSSAIRPQSLRTNSISSRGSAAGFPSLGKQPVPSTPPLLRKAAYDQDAEDGHFSESGFYDDESTVDGDMTPIGLNFGNELRH